MTTGTVKWYNSTKGYGFIQPDTSGDDVFVHATALEAARITGLSEGQQVHYETEIGRNGKTSAINLRAA
ncbi:cold shock transcriptional regulator [Neokomagataea thailandica NBRC 106555]|uniref:Cold-shock protein n=2 Tax=Neokomagataea TaxID=1223423 RepID=A0A4Y6V8H1_9PROT|nr:MULTISPECIES: cold-shock protein [Neokomagataea]QDH25644.1 cold-shock protein [Neokomagataea tanensis]GBR54747.1 cold shock transcriptional regulator [Neokomagataea thailandica NBRC 106555]